VTEFDSWPDQPLVESLTPREMDVLFLLAENRTNREIADELVLSLNTIKWYARQIYGKLGVDNRRQAGVRARQLGLLDAGLSGALPAHNLPAQLTPFLGRRDTLAEIGQLMAKPATRLMTVVGPGGIGKTRLAVAAAFLLREEHPDSFQNGIFLLPLATLDEPASLAAALAQAVGLRFYQAGASAEQQLIEYLSSRRLLLVLDGFEHLIAQESIRLLVEILAAAPGIRMLVTSRSRLGIQGEQLVPLGGLEIPDREEIAQVQYPVELASDFCGIQLFVHSARRLRPEFELDAQNLMPVIRICSLVGGMPLGIELAAAWVAVLEPEEIAVEIEQSLDILATDAVYVPERQQSLRLVFDASWKLLTEEERQAFQTLAMFEDGFDREAARHAGQVSLATLLALVNKSWIQQADGGRFQLHELLRRYGREKLARDPALQAAVLDRHSRYYCEWLVEREEATWGARQQEVFADIIGNLANVHAACRWAATQGRMDRLSRGTNALGLFHYQWYGGLQAGRRIFRELEKALTPVGGEPGSAPASTLRAMVRILSWQATLCGLVGDLATTGRLLREGVALLDGAALADEDTRFERAHIEWQFGYLLLYSDPETARRHFAQSLELYQRVGYEFGMASAQLGLGRAARGVHAFEEAKEALTASLALHQRLGNQHGEGETLTTLGGLVAREGRFDEAERLIEESLAITPEIDRFGIAFALGVLGSVQLHRGRLARAETSLRQCLALHRDLGMRSYGLLWTFVLAEVYLHLGNYAASRTQAQAVLSRAQELDYKRGTNLGLLLLSELALVEGAFDQAYQYLEESPDPAHVDALASREFGQLGILGLATLGLDRLAEAREHLFAALAWAREARRLRGLTVALGGLALLSAKEGDAERAVELYALASRYPLVARSRWFEDVIGRHIAAVSATLVPEVADAARERGKAGDLDVSVEELMAERAP
jgi:predicted ATPase/DNA-binding CsgD family transcriptional regulator